MEQSTKRPIKVTAEVRAREPLPEVGVRFFLAVDIWPEDADSTRTGTGERFRSAVSEAAYEAIHGAWLESCDQDKR